MLCHNFNCFFCTEMCKPFLKTYLHVLLITKIISLKWLPSAVMPKSVSKVGDRSTFFGLFTNYCAYMRVMTSQHMTSWQLCQKRVSQQVTSWQLSQKSGPKNQGTNAIIIALILLSLDPIVKSRLHSQGYNDIWPIPTFEGEQPLKYC